MVKVVKNIFDSTLSWAKVSDMTIAASDVCESTNNWAKAEAQLPDIHGKLYLAAYQTKGRGRGSNHWLTERAGDALLGSWAWTVSSPPQPLTSPLVGLALYRASVLAWPSLKWSLKAPNDLYLEDKKVAGLLIEVVQTPQQVRFIVGLGFNILAAPEDVSTATHLTGFLGLKGPVDQISWFEFLTHFHRNLQQLAENMAQNILVDAEKTVLLSALNANPFTQQTIIDLTTQGDLITEKGSIRWQDL